MAEIRELVYTGRKADGYDLGEELLRVAPDLHGGLGADVLCTHARTENGVSIDFFMSLIKNRAARAQARTLYAAPGAAV